MFGRTAMRAAAGVTVVALLVAGCTADQPDELELTPNTVSIGIVEPAHLLPTNVTDASGTQVLSALFYPLVTFDERSEPVDAAAESITSTDNLTWTVRLKAGMTFSNGERVRADNYLDAWNYGAYRPNAQQAAYLFDRIEGYADLAATDPRTRTMTGLRKVNDRTFTVTLSAPFSGWRSVLGSPAFLPLPAAAFSEPGVIAAGFEDAIVGNGAFRIKGTWQHGSRIQVERVHGWTAAALPKVDGITFSIYADPMAAYADLVAGIVDVQVGIPTDRLVVAPQDLGGRFGTSPSPVVHLLAFPTAEKEFVDPGVRRAISMAIDREAIARDDFLGLQSPATAFVSPVVAGYRANACGRACTYDPGAARAGYVAAGGPSRITLTYKADAEDEAASESVCEQLRAGLGVTCLVAREPTFADLLDKVRKKQPVGLIALSWAMDYPLPESYLAPLYSSTGLSNFYGYHNPEFDRLLDAGSAAPTRDAALAKWQQAEDVLANDMPAIPLRFARTVYGYSEKVGDVHVGLFQQVDVYAIKVVLPTSG